MALEFEPVSWAEQQRHICELPLPKDPEIPEGHACLCGKRWVYQPARWDPIVTIEELRARQQAGEFLRGIIPTFHHDAAPLLEPASPTPTMPAAEDQSGVIVPIPTPRAEAPRPA